MVETRSLEKKYGSCVICGNRVYSSQGYITVKEGYCHTNCLRKRKAFAPHQASKPVASG